MRRLDAAVLAVVGVLLVGAVGYGQREEPAPSGPDLVALREAADLAPCPTALSPDLAGIVLPCLGGGPDVDAGGTPARPTLLNVWGSWCEPCRVEVPDLVAFADKAAGAVDVVGVTTQDAPADSLSFAAAFGMRYPNVVDEDGVVRARYGAGAPLTLFLDATGTVTHVEAGKVDSLAELEALVRQHLGVSL